MKNLISNPVRKARTRLSRYNIYGVKALKRNIIYESGFYDYKELKRYKRRRQKK